MNGPDHYTRAEALLERAIVASYQHPDRAAALAASAQAEATLALAAAVVNAHDAKPETADGWRRDLVQSRNVWDDVLDDDKSIPISPWARAFANDPTAQDDEGEGGKAS